MCQGPSDTEEMILACLLKHSDTQLMRGMLTDWRMYENVGYGTKMVRVLTKAIQIRESENNV